VSDGEAKSTTDERKGAVLDMLRELRLLGLARRGQGAKSTGVSELIREAIQGLLEQARATPPAS